MNAFLKKYEIIFWDTLTILMANSKFVQKVIRIGYPIFQGIDYKKLIKAITISGVSGFATGWIIYYAILFFKN